MSEFCKQPCVRALSRQVLTYFAPLSLQITHRPYFGTSQPDNTLHSMLQPPSAIVPREIAENFDEKFIANRCEQRAARKGRAEISSLDSSIMSRLIIYPTRQ